MDSGLSEPSARISIQLPVVKDEVACLAGSLAEARSATRTLSARLPEAALLPYSLRSYLAALDAPARVVVCPGGRSLEEQLHQLRRIHLRLFWPAASADFRDAIGGLRTGGARPRRVGPLRRTPSSRVAAALLLEGPIDAARARAAIEAGGPLDWIVESVRHVRIGEARLFQIGRAGVRWAVLEPVDLVALCASPALAASRRWRRFVPARTPIWVSD
jgi:hypothetical protein